MRNKQTNKQTNNPANHWGMMTTPTSHKLLGLQLTTEEDNPIINYCYI